MKKVPSFLHGFNAHTHCDHVIPEFANDYFVVAMDFRVWEIVNTEKLTAGNIL